MGPGSDRHPQNLTRLPRRLRIADQTRRSPIHRLMGYRAPRARRGTAIGATGLAAFSVVLWVGAPDQALLVGWDVAAVLFIAVWWQLILSADSDETRELATVEDETRPVATFFVVGAAVASLVAVAITLHAAGSQHGFEETASVVSALVTVVLSWAVVNTVFTLRYADEHYRAHAGVDFGDGPEHPDYRDFAYLAFTVGMCYQVSDTQLRDKTIRRTVLLHAVLSYMFGVIIVAATINLVAGLLS
ncbi:MAG: DUF1345 domain-containing protein [Ilumatobacteraceae bacterium]